MIKNEGKGKEKRSNKQQTEYNKKTKNERTNNT